MDKDDVFEIINRFVLVREGGLTNDKNDAGGITNFGISLRFARDLGADLADIDGDGDVDADDIRAMTKEKATEFFRKEFWEEPKTYLLPNPVAAVYYDTAVNCGNSRAGKILQKCVGAKQDGVVGPNTRGAVYQHDAKSVAHEMISEREAFYKRLVEQKPSQSVFLKGWLNRCSQLRQLVKDCWG